MGRVGDLIKEFVLVKEPKIAQRKVEKNLNCITINNRNNKYFIYLLMFISINKFQRICCKKAIQYMLLEISVS